MNFKINENFAGDYITEAAIGSMQEIAAEAYGQVVSKTGQGSDFLGWVDLPANYDKEEFARIKLTAQKIKDMCDVFIVLGIGGSYLGARAAIEFVSSPQHNQVKKDGPAIYFAGNNISTSALNELLAICEGKDVCVNVISKSGTTTETAIAFRVFRKLLVTKYGKEEAKKRIFATTDKSKGTLKELSVREGYETFVIPDDVGGRFSVLTAVGLLPIAVAGISVDDMMSGAASAREQFSSLDMNSNLALRYAVMRNVLYKAGKQVEFLVGYEPYVQMLCEWWKQLFGESEGKEHKGIVPHSVIYTTDLHSLGQYVQEGQRTIFETVLKISDNQTYLIPEDIEANDGLDYLVGKTLSEVNNTAMLGTLFAHRDGDVPNLVLEISERSAFSFGYLVYFFELACAYSGYMLGVNPFNQPGVEFYKKNMFALLGKPGYENLQKELMSNMQ